MRKTLTTVLALLALSGAWRIGAQSAPAWDERYRTLPDAAAIGQYMERLSARPHHVGAPYTKDNAEWMLAKFREWGWEARIETYDVLFPTPKERLLEMIAPTRFRAALEEPAVAVDPTSGQKSEQLPTYNAYSIDGDVTGPLVYVNYGRPEDYEELEALGVSVRGAIVIARYGGSFRGTKPKIAAEHGAIGCLIYSDPRDDGYFGDAVFPDGPMRSKDGVQRGSVMDLPLYSGDPLTPGVAAVPGAARLALNEAATITKIPVLPISYGDAQPLLAASGGPVAPAAWRGALPITYRLGPGPARVHLKVSFNWETRPLYDVIARLEGAVFPDQWIVRGNHHDAWVNGASDPVSGMAPELEEARALGLLAKQGWRPKRTIVYAAWDGEEPGLMGSTEWMEQHDAELRQKPSSTSTATATAAASSRPAARTRSSISSTRWRAASRILKPGARSGNAGRPSELHRAPPTAAPRADRGPTSASARWVRAPTTHRFSSTMAPPRSTCRSADWTTTASTTRFTTTSITSRNSPTPASSTAARSLSLSARR